MSYEDATVKIGKPGLILVEGPNGVGKSSIWDAVSWAVFGKTVRGIEGDAVINRKFKENCQVTVSLTRGRDTYIIVRNRKHEEFGNRLWVDFKKAPMPFQRGRQELGTIDKTQEWLVRELGIDFDLFRCTVLFAQGETFNFVNESNGEQKMILSKIMRVDFSKQHQNAKEKLKQNASDKIEFERKLAVLESHQGDPAAKYSEDIRLWNEDRDERVQNQNIEILKQKERYRVVSERLKARPRKKIEELKETVRAKIEEIAAKEETIRQAISDRHARTTSVIAQIKRHTALLKDSKCPTCEEPVSAKKCKDAITALQTERDEATASHVKAEQALQTLLEGKKKYSDKLEWTRDALHEIDTDEKELKHAKKDLDRLREEQEAIKVEENPFAAKVEQEKTKQKDIAAKVKEITTTLEDNKANEPYLQFWVKAFGDDGIKSFIFDVICSALTSRANVYLNTLTDGSIAVAFDTQRKLKSGEVREKFDCTVITDGGPVPYENYSGGEKRRISLAVDLALSDLMSDQYGSEFNLLVFDEQTDGLNADGRGRFMNLLRDLSKKKAVYVVDHDGEFKAKFDRVLNIEKRDGISRLM